MLAGNSDVSVFSISAKIFAIIIIIASVIRDMLFDFDFVYFWC